LIRFEVVIYDRLDQPLEFDNFLNIGDKSCRYMLDALMIQEWIVFHWYGEDFKYRGSTGVHWREERRIDSKDIIRRAEKCFEIGGWNERSGNNSDSKNERIFNRVKSKFIKMFPMEY